MEIYKRYFNKYKFLFFSGVFFVFLEAVCDLMQPTIMARIIDDGVKSSNIETVVKYGILMLVITSFGACFAVTRNILASKVSQNFGADLRNDLFEKILSFSENSIDNIESGSLITRMTNDTSQIIQFVNGMMRIFFKAPITCLGSIILAVMLSSRLSLNMLLAVSMITFFIVISMKMSYTRFAKVQKAIDKVNTVIEEYLMGIRLVKAFGRFEHEEEKFEKANKDLSDKSVSTQLVISFFSPLMSLTINLGIVSIIYTGSIMFNNRNIEVGKVAAFISYMAQILSSLIMITNVFNTFVRTKASTERINEIFNSESDYKGSEIKKIEGRGKLEFKNVTFAYPSGSGIPILKNLSFQINKGETLAIIGPTGSGKSTIAWLCLRFYDVNEGAIYLNDIDIKKLDCKTLRDAISLAPQKSMLFTGTVFENIAFGNEELTKEEAVASACIAQAHEFIQNMPNQYESFIGQEGVNISGGQKQRISIARAIAKKSEILILDDCTSALDSITEAKVRHGLKSENTYKTIIVITQRIGSAMSADKILVVDNGVNVGFGSHDELINSCRTYKDIFDSQIGNLGR